MRSPLFHPIVVAAGSSLAVSIVWFALAWRTPTSTFHFAPLIASAVGPYVAKPRVEHASLRNSAKIAAAGLSVVTLAIVLLAVADLLRGPTFWSADGAWLEASLFAVVGSVIGLGYLAVRQSAIGDAAGR